ncbi:hypothetical protein ACXZ1M_16170 [Duganella sp. PWIR1]
MKKYAYAALLSATLAAPAMAANKFAAQTPEEPLHRRAILLCVAVVVCLHACRHRPPLPHSAMSNHI